MPSQLICEKREKQSCLTNTPSQYCYHHTILRGKASQAFLNHLFACISTSRLGYVLVLKSSHEFCPVFTSRFQGSTSVEHGIWGFQACLDKDYMHALLAAVDLPKAAH